MRSDRGARIFKKELASLADWLARAGSLVSGMLKGQAIPRHVPVRVETHAHVRDFRRHGAGQWRRR